MKLRNLKKEKFLADLRAIPFGHYRWVRFRRRYIGKANTTQFYDENDKALDEPIDHPAPVDFPEGTEIHAGICDAGDGKASLEIEGFDYGVGYLHGLTWRDIEIKDSPPTIVTERTMSNFTNTVAHRDALKANRNPGHEIGTFLLAHSNSPEYLISQLEGYLEALKADLQAEREWAGAMLAGLKRQEEPHHPDCPAVDGFPCHCDGKNLES